MDRQIQTTGPRLTKAKKTNKRKILTYIYVQEEEEKNKAKKKKD